MTSKTPPAKSGSQSGVNAIRAAFLDYFAKAGHAVKPSSSLVPQGDNTLLFTNAGMVQFKNIFTGAEKPFAPRAATSQKCVRAGGKHNDLDNVGYTARHLTFFEMLGNFSFGDYFKELAIEHAWTLVTRDFDLPKDKLLVTVYHDDDEAHGLWKKIAGLPDSRIIRIPTNDNFWMMGDTGPCGPCSEIFIDRGDHIWGGPPGSPEQDGDRFLEFWNLVFMQYEQFNDGRPRISLPKPSIDTGMGLERISAIMQGVDSVFETDLFVNLIAAGEELYKVKAQGEQTASFRVIADHLRSACFLIADGVSPSNEGRGYVLRRIMRRAMRHAHILGTREPNMFNLVSTLGQEMGEAYPDLIRAQPAIESAFQQEEQSFQRTLGRGLALLDEATAKLGKDGVLAGDVAFKLYDTFGFPLDLTQDVLRARGMTVDEAGFNVAMDEQRSRSQEHSKFAAGEGAGEVWFAVRDASGATNFQGYEAEETSGRLVTALVGGKRVNALNQGDKAELVFDQTPFYAESGGQSGDKGEIFFPNGARFRVDDMQKRASDVFSHVGELISGSAKVGDVAELKIDRMRRAKIRANHSATHLLHAALRNRLGKHVTQKGSLVEADYFRFDFSHTAPMTREDIEIVEAEVNAVIRQNAPAEIRVMAPDKAIEAGAMALFGEKYGDEVRVLRLGNSVSEANAPYSVELCGGTHVARTGDIAVFVITSEGGVAQGVRRIEGVTGAAALDFLKARVNIAREIADQFKAPIADAPARVAALSSERKRLEAELADARKKLAMGGGGAASGPEDVNGVKFIGKVVDVPAKDLKGLADDAKKSLGSGVAVFVAVAEGRATVVVGVTDDLTKRFPAGDLVTKAVQAVGGAKGGGRPDMAQGGGPDGAKANDAIAAVKAALAD
ncbi:MAG: alanine--tRNA ligase [Hyphomonadaceae bacterium]|jgi:alanyl-tRNA synthetase|nr:alanine--tRNA ligase [Hyphomonadaceae bacterium]